MIHALTCLSLLIAQPEVNPVTASLISEHTGLKPGTTATIALQLELDSGWHVYWDGYNDSGMAPSVKWRDAEHVKVGPIAWHAPHRYTSPGEIVDHIYEGRVTLLVPVTVAKDAPIGTTVDLRGDAQWMVCDEMCLLGSAPVSISLPVMDSPAKTPHAKQIAKSRAALPNKHMPQDVVTDWKDDVLTVHVPGAGSVSFYPGHGCVDLVSLYEDGQVDDSSLSLRTSGAGEVSGVIDAVKADGTRLVFRILEPKPS